MTSKITRYEDPVSGVEVWEIRVTKHDAERLTGRQLRLFRRGLRLITKALQAKR